MYFPENNAMVRQVESIPGLIKNLVPSMKDEVRFALSVEQTYQVRDLYLVGSGDSLIAAKAAAMAFTQLADVDVHVLSSLEAARYTSGSLPYPANHCLIVAVSNSGETARVVEALYHFKKAGATTLAVSAVRDSTLGRMADGAICTKLDDFDRAPEVRSYIANLIALYMLAIRMGENKGLFSMDRAGLYRDEILRIGALTGKAIAGYSDKLKLMAKLCVEKDEAEFLGSGPSKGAAEFAVAKIIEATGTRALSQEWEEFAHVNFFRRRPEDIPTVLFVPSATPAMSRIADIIWLLRHLGRPHLIVTDVSSEPADEVISAGEPMDELFIPLYMSTVAGQLSAYMNMFIDEDYYRGHRGVWDESDYHMSKAEILSEGQK